MSGEFGRGQISTQQAPPLDPYKMLQVRPNAPRQLIVAAYWNLASRWKQRGATTLQASESLNQLNAAYGLLMDDDQRRAYDEEHRLTAIVSRPSDYYDTLRIDRDADAEIIALAHEVLSRQATSHAVEDVSLRDLLDDAHRTLSNPQLRAQYNASLDIKALPLTPQGSARPLARLIQVAREFWTNRLWGARVERERTEQMARTPSDPQLHVQRDARRGESVDRSAVENAKRRPGQIRMAGAEEIRMARHDDDRNVATVPTPTTSDLKAGAFGVTAKLEQAGSATAAAAADVPGAIEGRGASTQSAWAMHASRPHQVGADNWWSNERRGDQTLRQ